MYMLCWMRCQTTHSRHIRTATHTSIGFFVSSIWTALWMSIVNIFENLLFFMLVRSFFHRIRQLRATI
ncbi:hypothetical protein AQUCO_00700431v1 [Aquilegia coerulea]|uniref:Uncharacterized protein n=1 Tax=Aquilegia coerulea TaxID=218851 RepID=A0A2G5EJZ7_AQUCA|nr:hypothetical protein AQUCO_00700431v1 [Aquilegia coerulea]